jgi:hypothetical protein
MTWNRKMSRLLGVAIGILAISVGCAGSRSVEENKRISILETFGDKELAYADSIIQIAHKEVDAKLSDPNLTFFSYVGECKELLKLNEQYTFMYIESNWHFFRRNTYRALVVIDASEKVLEIKVDDVSEHYFSTIPLEITGEEIARVARLAQSALQSENKCKGTIVMSKNNTEGPWGIRCGKPDEALVECMKVEPLSGTITIK